jgi:hypothetical protein
MKNKVEILSEALLKWFADDAVYKFEILYPLRTEEGPLLPPMRGRGFFPGADGLWKEDGNRDLHPFPDHPTMFVGQDFDSELKRGNYAESIMNGYQEEPAEGEGSETWGNQLLRLTQAGISVFDCFHTNLFPGLRISKTRTGPSTALADTEFVNSCVDFLDAQIRIVKPRAVIFLGVVPACEVFNRWLPEHPNFSTGTDIDDAGRACFTMERKAGSLQMAWMTHPSFGDANAHRRRFNDLSGVAAEQAILRQCAL